MTENQPAFILPTDGQRRLVTGWLTLALCSLVGAGLVVLLVILARVPVVHDLIPWTGSFKTALVIHVDLTVLVWFLSFAGLFAALITHERTAPLGRAGLITSACGAVLITFSPFLGEDAPFLNNYVPILANQAFYLGLTLFGLGFALAALLGLFFRRPIHHPGERALAFGVASGLAIGLLAILSLAWTAYAIPQEVADTGGEAYYEILFWGGGHILQFTHVQLLIVAWFWLGTLAVGRRIEGMGPLLFILFVGAFPALLGPVIHALYPVESLDHRFAFTHLMYYGGGPAALLAGVWVFRNQLANDGTPAQNSPQRLALLFSLILFGAGGAISFGISGVNTIIPAHYHGSIVSVTLAYMGLVYHMLPGLGYGRPSVVWARRQLILYSGGSLLHIVGLAWSGGHGVQRKTAGAAQGLETLADKIPMWVMGFGGVVAVLGGILFLVLAFRALRQTGIDSDQEMTP